MAGFPPQKSLKTECLPNQGRRASLTPINKVTTSKSGATRQFKSEASDVASRLKQCAYGVTLFLFSILVSVIAPVQSVAAPYAAMVMDARTGEVLHSRNADTRLHPASLTKMMTLYIAFQAIQRGEITLDTEVKISSNAASEPPSKLGLRNGQTIKLRYLLLSLIHI